MTSLKNLRKEWEVWSERTKLSSELLISYIKSNDKIPRSLPILDEKMHEGFMLASDRLEEYFDEEDK